MKTVKLGFVDFAINWGHWPDPIKFITGSLKDEYDVVVTNSDWRGNCFDTGCAPDAVICAIPGTDHKKYSCPKIYWPEEPWAPLNLTDYQYAMTFRYTDDPRHLRLPIYPLFGDIASLTQPSLVTEDMAHRKFCAVLLGHPYPHEMTPREDFFRRLCSYKHVDSVGTHLNNTGYTVSMKDKVEFIKNYKFVIAFESQSISGFTTEKCFQPLLANTVPIYWGNPYIGLDFNRERFLDGTHYKDLDSLIQSVAVYDSNPDWYLNMLKQPVFPNNTPTESVTKAGLVKFFRSIFG